MNNKIHEKSEDISLLTINGVSVIDFALFGKSRKVQGHTTPNASNALLKRIDSMTARNQVDKVTYSFL